MHRRLPLSFLLLLPLALLAACTPSGNGGGGDCRDGDDPCSEGFVCAAVSADRYQCRAACNAGACPIGQVCDPFFEACVPGDGPISDRGLGMDGGTGDGGLGDGGLGDMRLGDGGPARDAAGDSRTVALDFTLPDFTVQDAGFIDARPDVAPDPDAFFAPDAAPPERLLDGDWRVEIGLFSDNPLPFLLKLYVQGDRPPALTAIQHYCDGVPCNEVEGGRYREVDDSTNDILLLVDGAQVSLDVSGGLRITGQASPYGEGFDLVELTIDGRIRRPDRICGTVAIRLLFDNGEEYEHEAMPVLMQYVGEWDDAAPDLDRILGCDEEE